MNLQGREEIGYLHFLKASIGKSNPILTDSQIWRRRGRCHLWIRMQSAVDWLTVEEAIPIIARRLLWADFDDEP